MSHTTETLHVRGVRRAHLLDAITERMRTLGFVPVEKHERANAERSDPTLRRLALRRDGGWLSFADNASDDAPEIEAWGEFLSRALGRSVLTIWTWDGEASVVAVRWKMGKKRARLALLQQAFRKNGFAYAPAKVLWPWLPRARRDAILRDGIKLAMPANASTGDEELDEMLEGFDDVDRIESEGDGGAPVFVSEDISVAALCGTVGMTDPVVNPWEPRAEDQELLYRRG